MLRRLVALLVLAAAVGAQAGPATATGEVVRNPGYPFYEARLRATQGGRVWTGRIDISFTNLEAQDLELIYLRLWSNGVDGCAADAIEIWDLTGGSMGTPALNCTEVPVTLAKALAEGERATLSMRLRVTLPWGRDRFGYAGGLALVGTALPTLEVHDDQGWHHDPFEDLGESFYSVAGRYRVTLEGAPDLDTPTTGTLVGGPVPLPGGLIARTYAADGVRDFAWAAGRLEQVSGGTAPRVVVSYRAGAVTKTQAQRMLAAARTAVSTFSQSFGPYPYPELDVVLVAFSDFGMEYPTIVFSEVDKWTVAHEIAHQWWYGLVGNDQYAEPWLEVAGACWPIWRPDSGWQRSRRSSGITPPITGWERPARRTSPRPSRRQPSSTACPSTPTSTGRPGGWTRPEWGAPHRSTRRPQMSRSRVVASRASCQTTRCVLPFQVTAG